MFSLLASSRTLPVWFLQTILARLLPTMREAIPSLRYFLQGTLLASATVSIIAAPNRAEAQNPPTNYAPATTPYTGAETWFCGILAGTLNKACSFAGVTASISTLPALTTAASLASVGALSAGSATTGFTIAASNVTWTGTIPTARLAFTLPLAIANGGTGSGAPAPVAGNGISFAGSWPSQTISLVGGALGNSASANPTGTSSTAFRMMGLAATITPMRTGNMLIIISGAVTNDTSTTGCIITPRWGTGGAPANNTALTGNSGGGSQGITVDVSNYQYGFSTNMAIGGQAIGTAVWFDLALKAQVATGGTCSLNGITVSAVEL
jgi:hypothetical protein